MSDENIDDEFDVPTSRSSAVYDMLSGGVKWMLHLIFNVIAPLAFALSPMIAYELSGFEYALIIALTALLITQITNSGTQEVQLKAPRVQSGVSQQDDQSQRTGK